MNLLCLYPKQLKMSMVHVMPTLLLLLGVVNARFAGSFPDDAGVAPIKYPGARRICASLCMYGLGGKPCGKQCFEIQPSQFPSQLRRSNGSEDATPSGSGVETRFPRRDACPLLCHYQLGDPLCDCPPTIDSFDSIFYEIDFDKICAYYCLNHHLQINGCEKCADYRGKEVSTYGFNKYLHQSNNIDWDGWCKERCSIGDGGVACNCDILPLSLPYKAPDSKVETEV